MIRLLFVGDGERDAVVVPRLVEKLLGTQVNEETRWWKDLRFHGRPPGRLGPGKGYDRKLRYLLSVARSGKFNGVVATVDTDKTKEQRPGQRLHQVKNERAKDRQHIPPFTPLPVSLGEATPHEEAWLLDDTKAVRRAMKLPETVKIPAVSKTKDPKAVLESLLTKSPRAGERPLTVWPDIAAEFDMERCPNVATTGYGVFAKEVRDELGPLCTDASALE